MGGLWRHAPWLGVLFLFQGLSLAGLPPLSGFWGKYLIIVEGIRKGEYALVAASVAASILTMASMLKIWTAAFWEENETTAVHTGDLRWKKLAAVAAAMTVISLSIGLGAEGVLRASRGAAEAALDRQGYIDAVLSIPGKGREAR